MTENLEPMSQDDMPRARPTAEYDVFRQLLSAPDAPDELDIPITVVSDIILRVLFNEGDVNLRRLAEIIRLELKVLDQMLELEDYNEVVELLRTIIRAQEKIEADTKKLHEQGLRDLKE